MKRKFVNLAAACALAALALAPAPLTFAGGKGKSDRSAFSQSNGGSNTSLKLHSAPSHSLSSGGLNGATFSKSLSSKPTKSFSQLNYNNSSLQNLYSSGNSDKGSKNRITSSNNLLGSQSSSGGLPPRRPKYTLTDKHYLADAIKNGNVHPIDSGIGNGTGGGSIKWPGKFTATDKGTIADSLKNHKFFPVDGIRIGEPNGPGNGNKPGKGKGDKCHDNDCHDHCDFPWWTIAVGGCYPDGGYGGNCHNDGNCHNGGGCYDGGYYSGGGCYNNVVNYPPVTNVTVIEQPLANVAAAQPAAVAGIDLELLDVRLVDAGDAARNLGPRYRLTFGNRGTDAAGNFQVLLMASVDGTPKTGAPSATTEVTSLTSRQVLTTDVRLPLTAELPTMSKFIVVVDSAAQINETDEKNNVAVIDREKIATADLAAVATQ